MANKIKEGKNTYWLDAEGNKYNEKIIKGTPSYLRDALVEKIVSQAQQMQMILLNMKKEWEREISEYLQKAAQHEGLDEYPGGGTTLWNFDMSKSVTVDISKKMVFDERLRLAQAKINEVIESRSEGSDQLLVNLVNSAFKLNKAGEADYRQLLQLRKQQCEDPLWKEAMELIANCMSLHSTKTYYYPKVKGDDGKMVTVVIDFASLSTKDA